MELLISAVLLAGLYATMAYGLGLIYGVLRIVNLNHGGMIMCGAYLAWALHDRFQLDPFLSIPIVVLFSFAVGWFLKLVRNRRHSHAKFTCGVYL